MKHTPGPWEYRLATRGSWYIEVKDNPEQTVAVVTKGTVTPDGDGTANARLIAAAPYLLEALKRMALWIVDGKMCFCAQAFPDVHCSECLAAREAIAKAEGGEE